jgi:phytoene dehydrogenase-like protein
MTLPVDLLQRRAGPDRYDAVVVGAGVAGLVCAAVLARGGARTLLVEAGKRPGGQLQTVAHQGFAVDTGPLFWDALGFREVLAAVGASEVGLGTLHARDELRLVVAREGGSTFDPLRVPVPGGATSPSTLDAVRALYGVPPRVFAGLGELYQELTAASTEQLESWRTTSLGDWLRERAFEPVTAAALKRSAVLMGALEPERASLAHLAQHARWLASPKAPGLMAAGDGPVAGARGVVQALVDACIDAGADLRLGTRATGLALDRSRFAKLDVRREEQGFADEVLADSCVLAVPRAALGSVLPQEVARALDASFPAAPGWSGVGIAWALRGMPDLRGAGSAAGVPLVRLVAPPDAGAAGTLASPATLFWPSVHAPRVTPPDGALLIAQVALPAGATTDAREVGRVLVLLRTFVREIYPALPELLVWERHWVAPLGPPDPFVAPLLPQAAPGCARLAFAGADTALPGVLASGVAAAALSGKAAAERILGRS